MVSPPLRNDNSPALAGTVHHLYLALGKCFEMDQADQCVIIEKLGDLTVAEDAGGVGSEIKAYDKENALYDSHSNWWNTLRNWLQGDPRLQKLHTLVLETTQPFGEKSLLKKWNVSSASERLAILEEIFNEAKQKHEDRKPSGERVKEKSQSLKDMEFVLDQSRRELLIQMIPKIAICADMPDLAECRERIVAEYGKPVPAEHRSDYIGALFEIVVRPETIEKEWTITYEDFATHVARFTKRFHGGRRPFPTTHRKQAGAKEEAAHIDSQFVTKILAIEFPKKVPQAISDYLYATNTWLDEFKAHKTLQTDYESFVADLRIAFESQHEAASASCGELIPHSQQFYLKTIGATHVPSFPNLETPNLSYRNGVLHVMLDNEASLEWKLKP